MKIAFRQTPFSAEQQSRLDALARDAGYETLWCADGAVPTLEQLADCEALLGYFPTDLISRLPALRWVQTPAAGVEKLCAIADWPPDVALTNCSGAFGVAIAEYMLMGLLMLMRNMPAYMENQHAHVWKCVGMCRSVYQSRITVVGMGDIGCAFAARVRALGAYVRGVRRSPCGAADGFDEVFSSGRLADAVRDADAVALCLPRTTQTAGLVSAEVISAMSPKTIVLNCGRGSTVDQPALTRALKEGRIAGAVLDVTCVEPLPADDPLWDMKNVLITPHISGSDGDPVNTQAIYDIFEANLRRFLVHEPLAHVVNRAVGY